MGRLHDHCILPTLSAETARITLCLDTKHASTERCPEQHGAMCEMRWHCPLFLALSAIGVPFLIVTGHLLQSHGWSYYIRFHACAIVAVHHLLSCIHSHLLSCIERVFAPPHQATYDTLRHLTTPYDTLRHPLSGNRSLLLSPSQPNIYDMPHVADVGARMIVMITMHFLYRSSPPTNSYIYAL